MTKRFICMILCLIMILGVLPIAAGAAEISEVSILGVRQPIAGETFDTSYSIPNGVGYAKDSAYAEIEWYDQGTSFSAAKTYGTPSGMKLSSGAKAVSGHCYVAVLHLARKDNNTFPKKSFSVSVSDEMAMRVQGKDGWSKDISSSSYYGAVYLYYKTDVVYDDNNGIYLTLNRPFDGTVVAGERVWSASDFSFDGAQDFDLTVQWEVNGKTLSETDVFYYPGRTYTMWLYFKSQSYKRLGYIQDGTFVVLNGGDYSGDVSSNTGTYGWAKFQFTCAMTVSEVSIESIKNPEAGEAMQTSGFTCSPDKVSVRFDNWYQTSGVEFDMEATGRFKPYTQYRLDLTLVPAEGYTLMNLILPVIYANVGTVSKMTKNSDGTITVGISFRTDGEEMTAVHNTSVEINSPKVGESPSYVAAILGKGYEVLDDSEGYFVSGICWTDITQDVNMTPEERVIKEQKYYQFKAGHTYQVEIELAASDGYYFADDAEGKINGGETLSQRIDDMILLTYMFDTLPFDSSTEITDISVTIADPKPGNSPSFKATVPADAKYSVSQVLWFDDETSEKLTSSDKFVKGKAYILNMKLVPSSGCSFADLPYLKVTLNGGGAQIMPGDGTLTIQRTFILDDEVKKNPFTDVKDTDIFYDAVLWAYYSDPQITNGTSSTTFGPNKTVTRGQTVTFLWRAMGCPEPKSTNNPFEDVKSGKYYYKAVLWAVEQGITNGTDATHFSPDRTCSTAHIITFIYRTVGAGSNGWYKVAGAWAEDEGLLDGIDLEVSPSVDCPRADVVLFLFRKLAK